MTDDGAPVSKGVLAAFYAAGFAGVGLVVGTVLAIISAAGWDEIMPSPSHAFLFGFTTGTLGAAGMVLANIYRGRSRRE